MPEITKMMHEKYLKDKKRPKGMAKVDHPELSTDTPPPIIGVKRKRGLGDVFVALQAQKVYNPGMPSIPSPQPAPANTFQKGTTPAMDTSGAWGAPHPQGQK